MIFRTAFTQLNYSVLLLVGTVIGMDIMPLLLVTADGPARMIAGAAYVLMMGSFLPMPRFYGRDLRSGRRASIQQSVTCRVGAESRSGDSGDSHWRCTPLRSWLRNVFEALLMGVCVALLDGRLRGVGNGVCERCLMGLTCG
jgi:hypothetical protein